MLLRVGLFVAPAGALWALLPLVASRRLGLGAGGYGLLLGAGDLDGRRVAAVVPAGLGVGARAGHVPDRGRRLPGALGALARARWRRSPACRRRCWRRRRSRRDRDLEARARSFADGEPEVTHLVPPGGRAGSRAGIAKETHICIMSRVSGV
ncbi:MFS transporter [Spirilliplanes yamanashiensis]|uniref:MFS transporter n=1 Tax=Spirilliplanes yamanashiensis TaxID=42233 RepID=UPI001EF2D45E|nr:MFS transporter [Spirilliplanes yamanashiensis]MDP9818655.1 hypothetical protein [Spirilliplanes yamanashiensis]